MRAVLSCGTAGGGARRRDIACSHTHGARAHVAAQVCKPLHYLLMEAFPQQYEERAQENKGARARFHVHGVCSTA